MVETSRERFAVCWKAELLPMTEDTSDGPIIGEVFRTRRTGWAAQCPAGDYMGDLPCLRYGFETEVQAGDWLAKHYWNMVKPE